MITSNIKNNHKINEEYLLTLFKNGDGLLEIGFEKIHGILNTEFKVIRNMLEDKNYSARDVLKYIISKPRIKPLLRKINYCEDLSDSYQGFGGNYHEIYESYPELKNTSDNYKQNKKLLTELESRLHALCLEDAYDSCEEKIKNGEIIAYSHRMSGWSSPEYFLNKDFSLEIRTNFGYGRSSYFYTILIYKNIQIIPFSEWIIYHYARYFDIIRYSSEHVLDNKGWVDAFEYATEACNLNSRDEQAFVEKYIIEECEKMIRGLENYLVGDKFEFLDNSLKLEKIQFSGHELIEFRGEKISGALAFIENIIPLNNIVNIKKFINRIEKCNKRVLPMLKKELELIIEEEKNLNEQIDETKPILDKLSSLNSFYTSLKIYTQKKLFQENDSYENVLSKIDINNVFNILFPIYPQLSKVYSETKSNYYKITNDLEKLKSIKNNITYYTKIINNYFAT